MTVSVFITIDTEEDSWGDYRAEGSSVENISRIGDLQEVFDRYGAVPTYLVDWPVATDDGARRILSAILERGRCEIGTHCHPWNTPPFGKPESGDPSILSSLPADLAGRKIEAVHEAILDGFGITPVSFRAGRWAADAGVIRTVAALGYSVDSSVTPLVDWRHVGGPDYTHAPTVMYRPDPENIVRAIANGDLVEVPATIGFLKGDFASRNRIRARLMKPPFVRLRLVGALNRLGLVSMRWLSPEVTSGRDMIRLAERFIETGHTFLNMFFHSNSLLPGATPFVRNGGDREKLIERIDSFLSYAAREGFVFEPLSKAAETDVWTQPAS